MEVLQPARERSFDVLWYVIHPRRRPIRKQTFKVRARAFDEARTLAKKYLSKRTTGTIRSVTFSSDRQLVAYTEET